MSNENMRIMYIMLKSYINRIPVQIPLVLLLATMGACSVTSLQCGTDGDSSFVTLNTTPKVLSQNARNMGDLCAFAYDDTEKVGVLELK